MRLHPMRYEGVSFARSAGSLTDRCMFAFARRSTSPSSSGRFVNACTWSSRMPHSAARRAAVVKGSARCSRRSRPLTSRSIRGMTQAGVRWKSVSRSTSGWIAGTIWIAEAPVPITATRLPRSS